MVRRYGHWNFDARCCHCSSVMRQSALLQSCSAIQSGPGRVATISAPNHSAKRAMRALAFTVEPVMARRPSSRNPKSSKARPNLDGVGVASPVIRGHLHTKFGFVRRQSGAAQPSTADECVRLLTLNHGKLVVLARVLCGPILKQGQQVLRVLRLRLVRAVVFAIARVCMVGEERWSVGRNEVTKQETFCLEFHYGKRVATPNNPNDHIADEFFQWFLDQV